ncbi:TPA: hypothetical protein HA351_14775 [Methanosarcinaceae archaeon]|nr:hypothetical protein [Methanosarcinaceae archaeon]
MMGQKMKKYLKITIYTLVTLSLLIFISGVLVFSHPFFMNTYVNLLTKSTGAEEDCFEFHTYSKEEFAASYLNTSLSLDDDFIALFESRYGTENKTDGVLLIIYDIPDPEDRSTYTLYGINRYTDLVYTSTRKVYLVNESTYESTYEGMGELYDAENETAPNGSTVQEK